LSYSNYTVVNITDFSVDGGNLTIQFDLLNADETYDEMIANTVELVFSGEDIGYYMDMAPDEPMHVDAGGPYTGEVGDDIEFSGIAYFGMPPYTYEWDFGDDETATGKNPVHSYEAAGNYTVTLTVTDDAGSTANDTTLVPIKDTIPPTIQFTSPERALYIGNKKIMPFLTTIIVGSINIEVQASDYESGIDRVEFYIDNELKKTDNLAPYSWMWKEHTPFRFRHTIKAVAYDASGNSAVKEADVWKVFGAGLKNEKTTFYFKDVLNFEETEYDSMFGMLALASESHPTKRVDSKYPPSFFKINTSRILPRCTFNSEELSIWFTNWIFYFMRDEYDDEYEDLFERFELLFPHPFRILEAYEYDGNEQVEIKGDVVFDLYFSSEISSKLLNKDHVKIGLYSVNPESILPLPKEIKNATMKIRPNLLREIHRQKIKLQNIDFTLNPGEILLFQVEIIPSNKTIVNLIKNRMDMDKIFGRWEERANRWENSRINGLREIAAFINEIRNLSEDLNISKEDIAEIANVVRSISFVYDSVSHPSSVTMPFKLLGDTNNIDECTVCTKFAPCSKYNFLPTIRDVLDDLCFRRKTIKIGAGVVPSICGNIRNSCNSPCINLYRNKEFFDIESNECNIEQVIITDSADDLNILVYNMPNAVMINDSDKNIWFNISQKITIEIYGENPDNPMNASISIMGCGLNVFIDEDEAVEKDYFIDNGTYEVNISPKTAGTLTIAVTNRTENKEGSRDFNMVGLCGSVTTSVGDDKKITFGTTETIAIVITNVYYCEIHLTWFDKNWDNAIFINETLGDNTPGNGLNGEFEFVVTENDIPYDFGYIVLATKAGYGAHTYYTYDIVEIEKPILKKMFIRGRITNLNQLEETSTFNSIRLRCINFSPFSIYKYQSNEKLIVSNEYVGLLTKWYVLGFFEGALS
jgi:PKD repeat protein